MILASNVRRLLQEEGFFTAGIARVEDLSLEEERFRVAISKGYHAEQFYLANDISDRFQIENFLPECKSVVVALFRYDNKIHHAGGYKIARFKNAGSYQNRLKKRLRRVGELLQKEYGTSYRVSVDTSRVSERSWAVRAGLGYIGKHSLLISSEGTFFVLGLLALGQAVDTYDTPVLAACGSCKLCIEACPTQAIVAPYYIDSRKCLAYLTTRKECNEQLVHQYGWVTGCDICQEACPTNKGWL